MINSTLPSATSRHRRLLLARVAIASCLTFVTADAAVAVPPFVEAESWIVIDGESGQTLEEHDANTPRQPASLTKLMTAYLVLAAVKHGTLRWDEKIAILRSDVDPVRSDEAKMHLVPGQRVPARKLVEGLIAASANDAALVLARRVGGSVDGFEEMMNETARTLRMDHSHFSTPSGITTPGNYSTARDLSILARRITTDFPEYYSFSTKQQFAYGAFNKRNKNWLLRDDPTTDGMKTGRTQAAGFCIVATAHRTQAIPPLERRVFAVILGAPTAQARISGAAGLLNYGFSAFKDEAVTDSSGQHVVTRTLAPEGLRNRS